jgi:hypothetical protein
MAMDFMIIPDIGKVLDACKLSSRNSAQKQGHHIENPTLNTDLDKIDAI